MKSNEQLKFLNHNYIYNIKKTQFKLNEFKLRKQKCDLTKTWDSDAISGRYPISKRLDIFHSSDT